MLSMIFDNGFGNKIQRNSEKEAHNDRPQGISITGWDYALFDF